jgi:hypothetical protein
MESKKDNKITSDQEFKEILHSKMKEIHGSDYNKEVTENVANGLIEKYDGNYPAMFQAAFGKKDETKSQSLLTFKTSKFSIYFDKPNSNRDSHALRNTLIVASIPALTQLALYSLDFYLNKHKSLKDLKKQNSEEIVRDFLKSNRGTKASEEAITNAGESIKKYLEYENNTKYNVNDYDKSNRNKYKKISNG